MISMTRGDKRRGFTMIEMLVVMAIIAVLLTIALPKYFQDENRAKEAVLMENLHTTREVIDKFFADTGRYPESLSELVEKRYLRSMPLRPDSGQLAAVGHHSTRAALQRAGVRHQEQCARHDERRAAVQFAVDCVMQSGLSLSATECRSSGGNFRVRTDPSHINSVCGT